MPVFRVSDDHATAVIRRLYSLDAPLEIIESPTIEALLETGDEDKYSRQELLARYLYLQCVQDQGAEVEGVRLYVERCVVRLRDAGIDVLRDPQSFFDQVDLALSIISTVHQEVARERAGIVPNWAVFDQSRPIPSIMFRWGTPLAILLRLSAGGLSLLDWLRSWRQGAGQTTAGSPQIRMDETFGLGKAIGHKASWLFIKLVTHSYGLMGDARGWGPNDYHLPLDSNVGRVLMRSGIPFAMVSLESFTSQVCTRQASGRYNLAANKMRDLYVENPDTGFSALGLRHRRRQSPMARRTSVMWGILGALEDDRQTEPRATVGRLDDGLMHVGLNYCRNNDPDCTRCPLADLCIARQAAPDLIEQYYCGTGTGVFWA